MKKVLIVGGGYIGIETAEKFKAFRNRCDFN